MAGFVRGDRVLHNSSIFVLYVKSSMGIGIMPHMPTNATPDGTNLGVLTSTHPTRKRRAHQTSHTLYNAGASIFSHPQNTLIMVNIHILW